MELRSIGMILICTSTIYMFIRFFQVGLQRKYWVKKGVFRWHIIPGTALVWMSPYFIYTMWQNRVPNLWVATVAGVLGLSVCLTGFRMLMLLNRKDTRMKRWFFMICVFMLTLPLTLLSGILFLQEAALLIGLGRIMQLSGKPSN